MDFVVTEKSEVQVHHLVFNEMQMLNIASPRKFAKMQNILGIFPVSHSQQNIYFML